MTRLPAPTSFPVRAVALLLAALLVGLAGRLLILARADLSVIDDFDRIEAWQKANKPPQLASWQQALDDLTRALDTAPRNPDYLDAMAGLYLLAVDRLPTGTAEVGEAAERSLACYRRALEQVPSWPYYWVGIARSLLVLGPYGQQTDRATYMAAHYAPMQLANQLYVLDLAMPAWPHLSAQTREAVQIVLANALVQQPEALFRHAFEQGYGSSLYSVVWRQPALLELYEKEAARHPDQR